MHFGTYVANNEIAIGNIFHCATQTCFRVVCCESHVRAVKNIVKMFDCKEKYICF